MTSQNHSYRKYGINFINLGPLVLKAYIATSFSFIDNGVDRTRPASNGLNPAIPYNIIIATHTTSSAMVTYIAPYSGTALGE